MYFFQVWCLKFYSLSGQLYNLDTIALEQSNRSTVSFLNSKEVFGGFVQNSKVKIKCLICTKAPEHSLFSPLVLSHEHCTIPNNLMKVMKWISPPDCEGLWSYALLEAVLSQECQSWQLFDGSLFLHLSHTFRTVVKWRMDFIPSKWVWNPFLCCQSDFSREKSPVYRASLTVQVEWLNFLTNRKKA